MYINSPGGQVYSGLAIYDTMRFIRPDVSTMCIGQAASMGALLVAGGAAGKRYCLPHSRMMIHQPLGGFQGQATDIDIHAREILHIRDQLNQILAHHTGQPVEKVADDTERDRFLGPEDSVAYGLIDKVLEQRLAAKTAKSCGPVSCPRPRVFPSLGTAMTAAPPSNWRRSTPDEST